MEKDMPEQTQMANIFIRDGGGKRFCCAARDHQ